MTESGFPTEAIWALSILGVAILLLIYRGLHHRKRRRELARLLPTLGFEPIAEPFPEGLLPGFLFHPNGVPGPDGEPPGPRKGPRQQALSSRVLAAWSGQLAGARVTMMDVALLRRRVTTGARWNTWRHDWTVLRCDPGNGRRPPDLLVEEHVLFKGRIEGERALHGPSKIGEHYYAFGHAPDEELGRWINPELRERLERHRLWTVGAHDGVLYLSRGSSLQTPAEMPGFLREGEGLLAALLAGTGGR
jgi:hypothetical protein